MSKEYRRKFEPETLIVNRENGRTYRFLGETKPADGEEPSAIFTPADGEDSGVLFSEPISKFYAEEKSGSDNSLPEYRFEQSREPELGNLLFGNARGNYPLGRGSLENEFARFLEEIGCDGYGFFSGKEENLKRNARGGCENEIFVINPYYWGEDDEEAEKPNFLFIPENAEICWYKYPMRDAYSNVEISLERMKDMLSVCLKSVREETDAEEKKEERRETEWLRN